MRIKKDLFINSLKLVEIDGRSNIPTAVVFKSVESVNCCKNLVG